MSWLDLHEGILQEFTEMCRFAPSSIGLEEEYVRGALRQGSRKDSSSWYAKKRLDPVWRKKRSAKVLAKYHARAK